MPAPRSDDPIDIIDIIEQETVAVAQCFGVEAPRDLAAALVARITPRVSGESFYWARERASARRARCDDIRAAFNGANAAELAKKHGITARQVRRIVNG